MNKRAFDFIKINQRESKPRTQGITEIRGPYYTPMGTNYLEDLLRTMGNYIDSIKFAGGSFVLFEESILKEIINLAHKYDVKVSTGGFLERVLSYGADIVQKYIEECKNLGFDIIEVSTGFITIPFEDWMRLIERIQKTGLKAKPEIGIQFGAGGSSPAEELEAEVLQSVDLLISKVKRFIEAGSFLIMIESEGITENVKTWRTNIITRLISSVGYEKLMFEAADPDVFSWYIKNYGPEINLVIDHSQIAQLEALRSGIRGTKSLWGKVFTYK
jgi:phosphosulfolactate synthase (CoM biosynthesis protein A)